MNNKILDRTAAEHIAFDGYSAEKEAKAAADNSKGLPSQPSVTQEDRINDTGTLDAETSYSDGNDNVDVSWLQPVGSMSNEPIRENPYLNAIEVSDSVLKRTRYQGCLENYHTLANSLLDDELQHSTVLHGTDRSFLERTTKLTLESMDTRVVHGILRGDLPVAYRTDQTTKKVLDYLLWSQQAITPGLYRTKTQPVIYINYLVDKNGFGLRKEECDKLVQRLREYVGKQDALFACRVDTQRQLGQWSFRRSEKGERKYLGRETAKERSEIVDKFCRYLEINTEQQGDKSHLVPFREVGYTNNATRRLREHQAHRNSNFLMNLIQAVCEVEFNSKFRLDQYIVARLCKAEQAQVGEAILTRLADGYISSGALDETITVRGNSRSSNTTSFSKSSGRTHRCSSIESGRLANTATLFVGDSRPCPMHNWKHSDASIVLEK